MKVFISVENLRSNLQCVCKNLLSKNLSIAAVVKGNAYGHGIEHVVPTLYKMGIFFFVVSDMREARQVNGFAKDADILITQICETFCEEDFDNFHFIYTLTSFEVLKYLIFEAKKRQKCLRVHIKIDTGLSRLGFLPDQVPKLIALLKNNPWICVEGIFSHFAVSNVLQSSYSDNQEKLFLDIVKKFSLEGFYFKHIHLFNSMALLNRIQNTSYSLVRLGGLLYGVLSNDAFVKKISIKPVMSVKASVLSVKNIEKGTCVGYDNKYVAQQAMTIAVIDVGYANGMSYPFSHEWSVLINGQKRSVIGAVSMNMTMIQLKEEDSVSCGDEVVLIGSQGKESLRVETVAKKLRTVPYDLLCKMGTQRTLVEKNSEIHKNNIKESKNNEINNQCLC